MVSTYEIIKDIEEKDFFLTLVKRGVVPLSILDKKVYYERYLLELETKSQAQAILSASDEFRVSDNTIRRAIKFMEK